MNAKEFRQNRKALSLNQRQLAHCLDITRDHVSNIESGKRNPSKLLVRAFELLIELFLTENN